MSAEKSMWRWQAGLPASLAPAGARPRPGAAGGHAEGGGPRPAHAAPRGEEVPWPRRLAQAAGSEGDATRRLGGCSGLPAEDEVPAAPAAEKSHEGHGTADGGEWGRAS
ncbi:unnamed protein product [Prorocentrum cordatum]|uniref:Uncharacterized protein n=1 Tax=Prorocentrum cordatum TaxID=2364126 RepID=A0ABN9XSR8_9DINO|nr:unnamed protein product [Polarella glacialis]